MWVFPITMSTRVNSNTFQNPDHSLCTYAPVHVLSVRLSDPTYLQYLLVRLMTDVFMSFSPDYFFIVHSPAVLFGHFIKPKWQTKYPIQSFSFISPFSQVLLPHLVFTLTTSFGRVRVCECARLHAYVCECAPVFFYPHICISAYIIRLSLSAKLSILPICKGVQTGHRTPLNLFIRRLSVRLSVRCHPETTFVSVSQCCYLHTLA